MPEGVRCVTDTVARVGGDEFVVLLPGLHETGDAELVARKILQNGRLGFTMDGKLFKVTTSIGIAFARTTAVTSEALFASADQALYAAKNANRGTFRVMECNVETAQRPSRRHSNGNQYTEVDSSSQDSCDPS